MRNKMKGFTLVELIVVIVILGILSAIAVPRYIDATKQARIASLNGLAGSVNAAVVLAKAAWQLTPGATVTMEGQTVAVTNTAVNAGYNGTPLATLTGIVNAISVTGFAAPTIVAPAASTGGTATWTLATNCSVTYTDSAATTTPAAATTSTVTTGC